MEINIPEVVLIPRGHLLQEEDEDPEENSCIPRGTVQISAPSRWSFGEGDTREDAAETDIKNNPCIIMFTTKIDDQFSIRGASEKAPLGEVCLHQTLQMNRKG